MQSLTVTFTNGPAEPAALQSWSLMTDCSWEPEPKPVGPRLLVWFNYTSR